MSQFIIGVTAGDLPPSVPESFVTNAGTAVPAANVLNVIGGAGITTSGAGSTVTITATGAEITLIGDVGSAVGPTITQTANTTSGSSVFFSNSGSSSTLFVTDLLSNTIIGGFSGNGTLSGSQNTSVGGSALSHLTSGVRNASYGVGSLAALTAGSQNSAFGTFSLPNLSTGTGNVGVGYQALVTVRTGSFNTALGYFAGSNYTGGENSNISIGNMGVVGESNAMRLGINGNAAGQINKMFVAGVNAGALANPALVVIDTVSMQLAQTPFNISGNPWTDVTTATQALATNNGYISDNVNVVFTLPATGSLGDTIKIVGKLGTWSIAQNANQQILVGSASSTVGVGGSVAGTNVGDCITLVCITAGSSSVYRAQSFVGNFTVT